MYLRGLLQTHERQNMTYDMVSDGTYDMERRCWLGVWCGSVLASWSVIWLLVVQLFEVLGRSTSLWLTSSPPVPGVFLDRCDIVGSLSCVTAFTCRSPLGARLTLQMYCFHAFHRCGASDHCCVQLAHPAVGSVCALMLPDLANLRSFVTCFWCDPRSSWWSAPTAAFTTDRTCRSTS